jgi:hypothetical protein
VQPADAAPRASTVRRFIAAAPVAGAANVAGAALVIAVAAIVAGCGHATLLQTGAAPHPVTAVQHAGPPATATAYARRLLARLRLPGHAHRLPWPARPLRSLTPTLPSVQHDVTDLHVLYRIGRPAGEIDGYLAAHIPAGMRAGDGGHSGTAATTTYYFVDYIPAAPPGWVYQATLATAVVPRRGGGSLVRVDAQVAWYPPRSAAEHIVASRYRAVTATAPTSWSGPPRPVTRTFTAPGVVARLAALVNGWPAQPNIVQYCPAISAASTLFRLVFVPASSRWPTITINSDGCLSSGVGVGGHGQPVLDDGGRLDTAIDRLLGLPVRR